MKCAKIAAESVEATAQVVGGGVASSSGGGDDWASVVATAEVVGFCSVWAA